MKASLLLRTLITATALALGLGSLTGCERRVGEGSSTPADQPRPGSQPER